MTNRSDTSDPAELKPSSSPSTSEPGPLKALLGAGMAGILGFGLFRVLTFIMGNLPPVPLNSAPVVRSVGILVRYLIVGATALMTFMFLVVALGLLAYSGQLLIQKVRSA